MAFHLGRLKRVEHPKEESSIVVLLSDEGVESPEEESSNVVLLSDEGVEGWKGESIGHFERLGVNLI